MDTRIVPSETLSVLEMDRLLEHLADLASSRLARERLRHPIWLLKLERIQRLQGLVQEVREILEHRRTLSLLPLADAEEALQRLLERADFLDGTQLNALAGVLELSGELSVFFTSQPGAFPLCTDALEGLGQYSEELTSLRRKVDETGELKDGASPVLGRLRGELRHEESRIRNRLEKVVAEWSRQGLLSDTNIGWRDDRPVVQVPAGGAGKLDGLVVDRSASGRTLFVEPFISLEHRGKVNQLQAEIRHEEIRLYHELSSMFRARRSDITRTRDQLTQLDEWLARARLGVELGGRPVEISQTMELVIRDGRHPLLMRNTDVVPLNLELGPDQKVLLISGPNAGGKTVAMKTLGMFALMLRAGIPLPVAEGSRLPVFDCVLTDIGDRQSIENDLSTYTSHLSRTRDIVVHRNRRGLFLVDELGSGTDPDEGAAIAMAFLERMTGASGLTVASTHLGQLKAFAHERPGIVNGSMSFDEEKITPTYRFVGGVPGSSYALEILQRMDMPKVIQDRARHFMDNEQKNLARLISDLQSRLAQSERALKVVEMREVELESLVNQYRDKLKLSRKEARVIRSEALAEASTILKEANRLVEKAVRDVRQHGAEKEKVAEARETLRNKDRELESRRQALQPRQTPRRLDRPPAVGDRVRVTGLDSVMQVLRVDSGKLTVQSGIMKLSFPLDRVLEILGPEEKRSETRSGVKHQVGAPSSLRLDMRGMSSVEAMGAMDAFIDECMIAGVSPVCIVHGKGDGILRRVVHEHLARFECVTNWRLGNPEEGGDGVTIVTIEN
ncbi:MAG: Smr/MutS family protein [Calditrichaeota bacterium]|nr:Smr/MutS family protein [Calditrichota bacterium]